MPEIGHQPRRVRAAARRLEREAVDGREHDRRSRLVLLDPGARPVVRHRTDRHHHVRGQVTVLLREPAFEAIQVAVIAKTRQVEVLEMDVHRPLAGIPKGRAEGLDKLGPERAVGALGVDDQDLRGPIAAEDPGDGEEQHRSGTRGGPTHHGVPPPAPSQGRRRRHSHRTELESSGPHSGLRLVCLPSIALASRARRMFPGLPFHEQAGLSAATAS